MTARSSASGRMNSSAMQKIFTFSQKADRISGNVLFASLQSKNCCWISGQPGALTIAKPRPVKMTTVLTSAMTTPRRPSPRPRPLIEALLQDGSAGDLREPLRLQALQRPVRLQLRERLVDARGQRIALLQHHAEVLAGLRGQLAEDLPVRHLDRGDVERGRQVDDDRVDLLALEREHRLIVRVVDLRLRRRLDHVDD